MAGEVGLGQRNDSCDPCVLPTEQMPDGVGDRMQIECFDERSEQPLEGTNARLPSEALRVETRSVQGPNLTHVRASPGRLAETGHRVASAIG